MPYHFLEEKLEDAFVELFSELKGDTLHGLSIVPGFADESVNHPFLSVVAASSTPEVAGDDVTGNQTVSLSFTLVSHYGDTSRAQHAQLCGEFRDILYRADILAHLNTICAEHGCFVQLLTPKGFSKSIDGSCHMSQQQLEVYAMPSVPGNSSSSESSVSTS